MLIIITEKLGVRWYNVSWRSFHWFGTDLKEGILEVYQLAK